MLNNIKLIEILIANDIKDFEVECVKNSKVLKSKILSFILSLINIIVYGIDRNNDKIIIYREDRTEDRMNEIINLTHDLYHELQYIKR